MFVAACCKLDVCLSVHRCICAEKKNQLDATELFITIIIYSTCFGHFYAHHQELESICVLLPPTVCSVLVAGCRRSGAEQQAMRPRMRDVARLWTHSLLPAPDRQLATKALHTIGGNNTHIVSSDRLCGLVVRVSDNRYRGLGFDSRRYQIFWVVVGLERGPLSLERSIEELLELKSSGSGPENRD